MPEPARSKTAPFEPGDPSRINVRRSDHNVIEVSFGGPVSLNLRREAALRLAEVLIENAEPSVADVMLRGLDSMQTFLLTMLFADLERLARDGDLETVLGKLTQALNTLKAASG